MRRPVATVHVDGLIFLAQQTQRMACRQVGWWSEGCAKWARRGFILKVLFIGEAGCGFGLRQEFPRCGWSFDSRRHEPVVRYST